MELAWTQHQVHTFTLSPPSLGTERANGYLHVVSIFFMSCFLPPGAGVAPEDEEDEVSDSCPSRGRCHYPSAYLYTSSVLKVWSQSQQHERCLGSCSGL